MEENFSLKLRVLEYLAGINQPFKYYTTMYNLISEITNIKLNTACTIAKDCHDFLEQNKDCIVRFPNSDRILVIPSKKNQSTSNPYVCLGISHDYLDTLPTKSNEEIDIFATDPDSYSPILKLSSDSEDKLDIPQEFTPLIGFGFNPSGTFLRSISSNAKI